ncbi:hypothetical protein ACLILY_29930, partial [Mycobacterium sp. MS3]
NVGSFHLADGQGLQGPTIAIDLPAIPINLVAATNLAIPITGQIDPITIQPIPQFNIAVNVTVTAPIVGNIPVAGTLLSPSITPIRVNAIVFESLVVGADIRIPFDMTLLGRLNVTLPGQIGIGNSSVSSGYFNGGAIGSSGFFNSSDLSSGFANANGALTSGWYNSGSVLSGFQNLGTAISGVANTSTLAANTSALISGVGNIGSQVSGFWNGQMEALQAALAAISPIQGGLVVTTT